MFNLNKINKLEKTVSLDTAGQPRFIFTRRLQEMTDENVQIKAENVEIKLQYKMLLEQFKNDKTLHDTSKF